MRLPSRIRLAALALAAAALAPPAAAFAISDPGGNGPARRLDHTERWEITDALDGLDYSIHDSVCTDLRFIDGSTCDEIKAAIREMFDLWSVGHAYLHFRDISATHAIFTTYGESGVTEIGVATMSAARRNGLDWGDDNEEKIAIAHTRSMRRLNGQSALQEATILMNDGLCFYLDFTRIDWEQQASCPGIAGEGPATAHKFRDTMAHEIGHTLGLEHPDLEAGINFDDDDIRDNAIRIDCMDPAAGLRPTAAVSVYSVMNRSADFPIERGLSHDDLAGRNFLYPACESAPTAFDASPVLPYTALVAVADEQGWETGAITVSAWNPVSSVRRALDSCAEKYAASRCRYAGGARGWIETSARTTGFATRESARRLVTLAFGTGRTQEEAEASLSAQCDETGGAVLCVAIGGFPPNEDEPPWLTLPDALPPAQSPSGNAVPRGLRSQRPRDPGRPSAGVRSPRPLQVRPEGRAARTSPGHLD